MTPAEYLETCQRLVYLAAHTTKAQQREASEIAKLVYNGYFANIRNRGQFCAFVLTLLGQVDLELARESAAAQSTQREKGVPHNE